MSHTHTNHADGAAVRTSRGGSSLASATTGLSIGEYLIRRLQDYGIGHVFGIPGDYILRLLSLLEKSPIEIVGCTREDCAGFAADAYARVHGMGAVCVTYCVGGLSLCNSIAGAYAEKSPVVVITGSPGLARAVQQSAVAPPGARFSHAIRRVRKAVHRLRRAERPADRFSRDRPRAARRGQLQAAGVYRDSARHGRRGAGAAAPVSQSAIRPAIRTCWPRRSNEAERWIERLPAAGDHRRRGDSPLRPAGRTAGAGRGLADSDHHHDARQEHDSRRRIRCSSACTKGRWATTRSRGSSKRAIA